MQINLEEEVTMSTYYPLRAAAKHAGVSKRTIYRWIIEGIMIDGRKTYLTSKKIDSRICIEEYHLNTFLTARSKFHTSQKQQHEKFTLD